MGEHLTVLDRISKKKTRLALVLTTIIVAMYSIFVGFVAFNKAAVACLVMPGLSMGILIGVVTMVVVWVATFIYIIWTNTYYDQAVDRIRKICIGRPHHDH